MLIGMKQPNVPNIFSDKELSSVDVKILDGVEVKLRCERCGAEWIPKVGLRGRLPPRYWNCPNECNVPQES